MAFLDNTGLAHLWSKITTALSGKLDKTGNAYRAVSIPFGQVDSTSTATVFTATVPGITELRSGVSVMLMNGVVTSASGFTVNINNLGAKPVYSTLSAASRATTLFNVAYTFLLVYNEERVEGGCWDAYYGYDSNTNTIGYQLRTNSTTMPTLDKFYRYRLLFTSADRHHYVPANTSSSTSADTAKAVNQRPIDPYGAIYYYGHTTAINANANPTASYFWTQYSFALGYSFNRTGSALTLTNHAPVYIKCAPQSDGSAIIDADTPFVQTLPSTADGKIYIYLGIASSATAVELVPEHPVFCYRNGQIRPWTGSEENELPDFTSEDEGKVLGIVDGAWALKEDATGGGGGGGTSPTLLGTTPLKLTADADNLILSGSGEISYSLQSDTVADFPVLSGTANNATVTQGNGVYVLTAGSGASAWYQAYVDITISGLVVNQSYNFVFDAAGCDYDETAHRTIGHYILYDGSGNTLVTRGATDTNRLNSYAFTAPTTSVRVRWYPATNNTFSSGVSVATVNAIYINRAGTTEHTAILDASGTFTDSTTIPGVPAGTTVTSTPSCSVYSKASESGGAALPLEGKTVVCFGDSLFGLYRGSTSAPAYVEKVTGATVYNVGFGGCRMSDHPSHGYAEFSMWALAHAIATDTWTDQDTYASQGSDYFPEQLATLKGIDFSTVDYAVIHYGTNDFGGGVAIGADSAATVHNTLCGALRYSIETLLTAYPKLRIFVSLPCFRFWTVDGQTVYSDTYTNSQNKTLVEYVAALRAVAGEYNVPVIENYTGNGINKVNASTFLGDGTHHNADGRERFGTYIAENLISGGSSGIAAAESNSFGGGA